MFIVFCLPKSMTSWYIKGLEPGSKPKLALRSFNCEYMYCKSDGSMCLAASILNPAAPKWMSLFKKSIILPRT